MIIIKVSVYKGWNLGTMLKDLIPNLFKRSKNQGKTFGGIKITNKDFIKRYKKRFNIK